MPVPRHDTVSRALDARRAALAEAITDCQYRRQPGLEHRYGAAGREKCVQDAAFHLTYLSQAVAAASPALFSDYVAWATIVLAGRGVPAGDLAVNLECLRDVLNESLSGDMSVVTSEFVDAALGRLQSPPRSDSFLAEAGPLADLADAYLAALLRGDRRAAAQLIMAAVEGGAPLKDIYLYVFQPTQYEIGRLWQLNQLRVAQEHFCTAATQLIMAQLYSRIVATEKRGRVAVVTTVSGELHEVGIRVVADFLEMDGWDTYYLGASLPAGEVVRTIIDRGAHLLAISATMGFHIQAVAEMIGAVRATDATAGTVILVGGYPFKVDPALWRTLGADASGVDAAAAVAEANRLVEERRRR